SRADAAWSRTDAGRTIPKTESARAENVRGTRRVLTGCMNTSIHFVSLFALALASGCTLETVDSTIDVDFDAKAEGVESHNTVSVNPNENPDVVANRDYIKGIDVASIVFTVRSVAEDNRAESGSGEVYVRAVGAEWDAEPLATFEETPVQVGVTKTLAVTPE